MLKQDKKVLKAVLRLLYYSANYFKIKKNGTIIIKDNFWSIKQYTTSLTELVEDRIPRIMSTISMIAAENYSMAIYELEQPNEGDIISITYEHLSTFKQEENFLGICLDFDLDKSWLRRQKEYLFEKYNNIKACIMNLKLNFNISAFISAKKTAAKVEAVKALPSKSIASLEEVVGIKTQACIKTAARCFLGKPEYDEKFKRVERIVEFQLA